MSGSTWANVAYAVFILALAATFVRLCRSMDRDSEPTADTTPKPAAGDRPDPGPDGERLIADLDRHLNVYVAYSPDLNAAYGPSAPMEEL